MKSIEINGKCIKIHALRQGIIDMSACTEFEKTSFQFIVDWLNDKQRFSIQTSGSTGIPKTISFSRKQLQDSALRSNHFFQLTPGKQVLCSLHTKYVAGMMMLVRALAGDLALTMVKPQSNPLQAVPHGKTIDFIAMTPMQVERALPLLRQPDHKIKTILLGGAAIHPSLEKELKTISVPIYHSYAMTETLTHVAIRRVNSDQSSAIYQALPQITFAQNEKKCLKIHDALLGIHSLQTNDVIELISSTSFRWIGRADLIINSGGIKIQLEQVESAIHKIPTIKNHDVKICVTAIPDTILSQKMVLLIEQGYVGNLEALDQQLKDTLPPYHAPRNILIVPELFFTKSGKPDRIKNTAVYLAPKK